MFRPLPAALTLLLVACLGPGPGRPAGLDADDDEGRTPLLVRVRDTLSGQPLPGALVAADDRRAATGEDGRTTLMVRHGTFEVTVSAAHYDRYRGRVAVNISRDALDARLVPSAPTVTACRFENGVFRARVTDLGGRKTILRRAKSYLEAFQGAELTVIPTVSWRWHAVDDWTYEVEIPAMPPATERIRWIVYDRELHVRPGLCTPSAVCLDCPR